ncbi:MAG: acyl-CoA dehydrogenase [Pararhodobacter sp.]
MSFPYLDMNDLDFMLADWLDWRDLAQFPAFAEHDEGTFREVIALAEALAQDQFAPHNRESDQNEPRFENGRVVLLPAIEQALDSYREAGLMAADFVTEQGGAGLPTLVSSAVAACLSAANIATCGYVLLTRANARLIVAHGTPAQIETWAKPQLHGRHYGTMCLSEPQAGSSLGDIRTRATPDGEDDLGARYRLRGNKMWISGGEHEMGDNIVHLVLAKIAQDDGSLPAGTKGISLFAVPRILPDGRRNDVTLAGLNHKLGYRGTVNTLLNFGEGDGALGWRIGGAGQGLAIMFQMMNEARVGVGLGAAALACRGYRQSLAYARERPQGRPLGVKDPTTAPVPLIAHPDVRRMLIVQKALAEGALGLVLRCARLIDEEQAAPDEAARQSAGRLLGLLTPVVKTFPSEMGLRANDLAIQIHGGYGYTRDYDVEQIWRDNRLNPIHEGTTGIQGLDLLGRKIIGDGGASLQQLVGEIRQTLTRARAQDRLIAPADSLQAALEAVLSCVERLQAFGDPRLALQHATPFLMAFGHLVVGWVWLDKALAALAAQGRDPDYIEGKVLACQYFMEWELPRIHPDLARVAAGDDLLARIPEGGF